MAHMYCGRLIDGSAFIESSKLHACMFWLEGHAATAEGWMAMGQESPMPFKHKLKFLVLLWYKHAYGTGVLQCTLVSSYA